MTSERGEPLGWRDAEGPRGDRAPLLPVRPLRDGDSLLAALDESIASPAGLVARVDADGVLTGVTDRELIANLFSTDPDIQANGWIPLADPKQLIPAQHIVPVIRSAKADAKVRRALARLGGALTTQELAKLNKLVDMEKKDPDEVAADWAKRNGLTK